MTKTKLFLITSDLVHTIIVICREKIFYSTKYPNLPSGVDKRFNRIVFEVKGNLVTSRFWSYTKIYEPTNDNLDTLKLNHGLHSKD